MVSRTVRTASRLIYELLAKRLPSRYSWASRFRVWLARAFLESAHRTSHINEGVRLSRRVVLAERAGVGARAEFLGGGRVSIGRDVTMGPDCLFITATIRYLVTASASAPSRPSSMRSWSSRMSSSGPG